MVRNVVEVFIIINNGPWKGDKYEGDWQDDKRHGNGTLTCSDGSIYEGDYKDDERHGNGV